MCKHKSRNKREPSNSKRTYPQRQIRKSVYEYMFLKRERLETDDFGRTNNQFVKALFCIFSSPTNLHIRADKGFALLPPSGHVR